MVEKLYLNSELIYLDILKYFLLVFFFFLRLIKKPIPKTCTVPLPQTRRFLNKIPETYCRDELMLQLEEAHNTMTTVRNSVFTFGETTIDLFELVALERLTIPIKSHLRKLEDMLDALNNKLDSIHESIHEEVQKNHEEVQKNHKEILTVLTRERT